MNTSKGSVAVWSIFSKNFMVKRKINIEEIKAISYSTQCKEFVLHIPNEYDYRFCTPENREKIFSVIAKGYMEADNKKLAFWFKDDLNLS